MVWNRLADVQVTLILAASLSLAGPPLLAQGTGTVGGVVTVVGGGVGVPGVRVELGGTQALATTDEEGRFEIESIRSGRYELRAEAIGCSPVSFSLEVPPGGRVAIQLTLDGPAMSQAQGPVEVRVAAEKDEPQRPYAVGRLERKDIAHDPSRSIADLIRGAFPGVKVVQGSGLPGSRLSIQLRGPTSLSGSGEPLVVVDGMITGGGLDDLDPYDVERIEVMKGPVAAAAYGARGRAGVIEITTQRGRTAAPPRCFLRRVPSP